MFEGRVFQCERIELKASSTVSKTLPGTGNGITRDCQHDAFCTLYSAPGYGTGSESETWFDDNPSAGWDKFLDLYVHAEFGANTSGASLSIPVLGISGSDSGAYADSVEATVEIDDYKLYVHNSGVWIARFSDIRFYFNGALVDTYSGAELMSTAVLNPWSMPFLGILPRLHGTVAATWSQGFPTTGPYTSVAWDWDETASAEQTIGGGIRYLQDSTWFAWNVTPSTPTYPEIDEGCGTATPGSVDAVDTWSTTLSQANSRREAGAFCTATNPNVSGGTAVIRRDVWTVGTSSTAAVWLWPDLERAIERWTPADYRSVWFRWGFPWSTGRGLQSFEGFEDPFHSLPAPHGDSGSTEVTIHSAQTQFLACVTSAAHTIEAPLSESLPMPTLLAGSFSQGQEASDTRVYQGFGLSSWFPIVGGVYTGLPPGCPNSAFDPPNACDADISWEYPYRVQKVADSSGNIPNVHKHPHPYVRLWATWFNPIWSYGLWFPPDEAGDTIQWKIGSSSAAAKLYWLLIAQQHNTHPSLPMGENARARNFVLTEPLNYSGLRGIIEADYLSQWTSWPGISRFTTIVPTIPSTKTLDDDSEDAWTLEDCSATFGTDIVIDADGTGSATVVLTLDIGRFEDSAYQYPYLCKSVFLDWLTANVDEVRVYLVSYSGKRVLLEQTPGDGFTTHNHTYVLPRAKDEKYAGSYAQDFGGGYLSDVGTDSLPDGVSSTLCADNERQYAFGLLQAGHGVSLRFEIDVLDCETDVTLKYPRWEIQTEDPRLVVETASTADLIYPDGPGVRLGQFCYWDYFFDNFLTTPQLWDPGLRMSALDGLCLKRQVFESKAAADGLDTEIASIYESGIEYTLRAHLARDPIELRQQTHAFLAKGENNPVTILLVSSLREPPPLAAFPFRKRNTDWEPVGDHAQVTYSNVVEPRRYVHQGTKAMHLHGPSGPAITGTDSAPTGWRITKHRYPTDGTEDIDHELRVGTMALGEMRPWHGAYALFNQEDEMLGAEPWLLSTPWGHLHRTISREGDIYHSRADAGIPPWDFESHITDLGTDHYGRTALDAQRNMKMVFQRDREDGADVYWCGSYDDGKTFSTPELFMADRYFPMIRSDDTGGIVFMAFGYDSGTSGPGKIYVRYQGPGDASPDTERAIEDDSGPIEFEPGTFGLTPVPSQPDRWMLSAVKSGEAEPTEFENYDSVGFMWREL